jgi:hypothetical protein
MQGQLHGERLEGEGRGTSASSAALMGYTLQGGTAWEKTAATRTRFPCPAPEPDGRRLQEGGVVITRLELGEYPAEITPHRCGKTRLW